MQNFSPKSKLVVITKSGIDLGKVSSIEINTTTGKIESFHVASSHVISRLLDTDLIVGWNQVIVWEEDKIIVGDAVVPAEAKNIAIAPSKKAGAHLSEM
jgi:sporulation protein YlmC with PRC-barrel domain